MPKSRKYNKRGGFLENTSTNINSGLNTAKTHGTNALNTINKSANDAGKSIGDFFTNGYNKFFGKKEQTTFNPYSSSLSNTNTTKTTITESIQMLL